MGASCPTTAPVRSLTCKAEHATRAKALASAEASVVGKNEERAGASLFSLGGTHAMRGEFAGSNDFEVRAFMVVLPAQKT